MRNSINTKSVFKKSLSILLSTAMLFSMSTGLGLTAFADTYSGSCGDSLTWSLDTETGELVIEGEGDMTSYSSGKTPWYTYKSYITSVDISDGVTSISKYAFYYCSNITTITIPASITSIGDYAFQYCSSLEIISVSSDNEYYTCEDGILFSKDKTELVCYPAGKSDTSYTVADTVTTIKTAAFYSCENLTSVTISDSVITIEKYAFAKCSNLESATIGEGVTSIGSYAFSDCSLTSITIPDSVVTIGSSAFRNCTSVTSIFIGSGVTTIGSYAFYNCTGAATIIIGDNVTTIENYAFYNCSSVVSLSIPDSVTTIGIWAFYNGTSLETLVIGNGVTSVGKYAFWNCSSLTEVYYTSSEADWEKISFGSYNTYVTDLTVTYDCVYTYETLDNGSVYRIPTLSDGTVILSECITYVEYSSENSTDTEDTDTSSSDTGTSVSCNVKLSRTSITYVGTVQRPTVTVTDSDGNALTYKEDFTVSYSNWSSINVGTYTVTVKYLGDYSALGSEKYTYKITALTSVTPVLNRNTITMNGTVQRPTVTVTDKYGNKLTYKKDFTVDYSNWNSKAVGRYTVTVKMIGNYSGTKTYPYYINPKSTTITSVTGISKGFTVKWNKQTNSTTGYQIQYATKSDFSNAATIYAGASSATSKTITGRAAKTKYYVRIRTYKNIGGKYFYSDWSSAKTVTTK